MDFDETIVDIIETFDYYVLVQEIDSREIYLVPIDLFEKSSDNVIKNNTVSLKEWIECQKEKEISFQKQKIKKKPSLKLV